MPLISALQNQQLAKPRLGVPAFRRRGDLRRRCGENRGAYTTLGQHGVAVGVMEVLGMPRTGPSRRHRFCYEQNTGDQPMLRGIAVGS